MHSSLGCHSAHCIYTPPTGINPENLTAGMVREAASIRKMGAEGQS